MQRILRPAGAAIRLSSRPTASLSKYGSLRFASIKAYTEDHEWISYDSESKIGTVGITDYAQKALGDVVFVELPTKGSEVAKQDQIGAVESVKAASDIFAPVSGTIESINESLGDQPSLLNRNPEGEGWLCKIQMKDLDEVKGLMDAEAYKAHCEGKE